MKKIRTYTTPDPLKSAVIEGNIVFTAGDNLTIEKKTASLVFDSENPLHPDMQFMLAIDKPSDATAGNLTINTYNEIKIDNTNVRDTLHTIHTVEEIAGGTFRSFIIQGLFVGGEDKIKIGAKFATDSTAGITVHFKLFRI